MKLLEDRLNQLVRDLDETLGLAEVEPAIAEAYSDLKRRLADTVSKKGFTEAKTPFIEAVLGRRPP